MTHQSGNISNVEPVLDGVSLERLKQELDRRNEESLRLQIEAHDRWVTFMSDAWPNRFLSVVLPMIFFVVLLFLIRQHLPFYPNRPIEVFPTLALFGMFVPVLGAIYKENMIWEKFREIHPEDAALIEQLYDQESAD